MSNTQLLEKIDAAIAEKNLLKHPFYQEWQAGKLSRESLQLYAAQYYRHVEAFPKHLRMLADRADVSLKPMVLENLAEEENPASSHPQLWRDFAAALGVSEEDITSSPSLPGTQHLVHTFRDICANRSVSEAVFSTSARWARWSSSLARSESSRRCAEAASSWSECAARSPRCLSATS